MSIKNTYSSRKEDCSLAGNRKSQNWFSICHNQSTVKVYSTFLFYVLNWEFQSVSYCFALETSSKSVNLHIPSLKSAFNYVTFENKPILKCHASLKRQEGYALPCLNNKQSQLSFSSIYVVISSCHSSANVMAIWILIFSS